MQPVSTSNIQNNFTTTPRQSSAEQTTQVSKSALPVNKTSQPSLPEDIVTLSAPSTMAQDPSKNPIPSTPVFNTEREALLKGSAGKSNFSTYA
ncbi:MAG: hypothetical protein PHH28_16915 [Desulfuromonadaceae bacterium]|nr:hypothetical protein [Desulfuromonadaceae bacterium]